MCPVDGIPDASASLDFNRPVAEVQAMFFDVELSVRNRIHRGVRLQMLPHDLGGERRLRRHVRVLDKLQYDDVVIERSGDGAWVERFVDGHNAGTRFVAHFEPKGPGTTRVRMDAFVGPQGFAQGLGRLSPLGLEKAMKRTLAEYRRALEAYQPGRARQAVAAALGDGKRWTQAMAALQGTRRTQVIATLLETAWSIACVDEGPDEAEREALRAVVTALWHTSIDRSAEERMVHAAIEAVNGQGAEARLAALGSKLRAVGLGELGVHIAVLVAEVSHGLDPAELGALRALAHAAEVPDETLLALVRQTEEALAGGSLSASSVSR
jgi:hypothetical protein